MCILIHLFAININKFANLKVSASLNNDIPNKNSAHNFVNSSHILWNNQLCTYKGQVIFNHNWIKRAILFVSDVLVNNKLCNYEDLTDRIENNPIRRIEYNVIRNAIPDDLINTNVCTNRDFTIYLDNKPLHNISTQEIRNIIMKKSVTQTKDDQESKEAWSCPISVTKEVKLIVLEWKNFTPNIPYKLLAEQNEN